MFIYLTWKDENIPPSWTRAEPTEILGCSLVRPNVKVGHRPERQNA